MASSTRCFPDMDAYGFSDWEGNDKAFGDKQEVALNLMNQSHDQRRLDTRPKRRINAMVSFRGSCKPS